MRLTFTPSLKKMGTIFPDGYLVLLFNKHYPIEPTDTLTELPNRSHVRCNKAGWFRYGHGKFAVVTNKAHIAELEAWALITPEIH